LRVACTLWFGDPSVDPDFGLGKIDLVVPNYSIAVGIGMSASKYSLILQRAENAALEERSAVVHLPISVLERDQQRFPALRLDLLDSRVWVAVVITYSNPGSFL